MTNPKSRENELRKKLEKVYNCQFCDGKKKLWDSKRQKYIPCPHTETTDKLLQLISDYKDKAVEEAVANIKAPKKHLLRNEHGTLCGYGVFYGVEVVEIPEDATCKTCLRLNLESNKK